MVDIGNNIDDEGNTKSVPAPTKKIVAKNGKENLVNIMLEDVEEIPPTGLFLSANGRTFLIRPGEKVQVPEIVVNVLKDAVISVPQVDPATGQVLGYRDRMRYPFHYV